MMKYNRLKQNYFRHLGISLFIVLSFFMSIKMQAQQSKSLEEVLMLALKNNASVQAKELEIKAAESTMKTAGELPKLNINAQFGQFNSVQFDNGIQFSQSIPWPGVFTAKRQLYQQEVQQRNLNKQMSINELTTAVRTRYYQMQYYTFQNDELQQLDSTYAEMVRIIKAKYNAGDVKKVEVNAVELKKGSIHLLKFQNLLNLQNIHAELKALINDNTVDTIVPMQAGSYEPLSTRLLFSENVLQNNVHVKLLEQTIIATEKNKQLIAAQNKPDITFGYTNQSIVGYQLINGADKYYGPGYRFNVGNVGLAVPLNFSASRAKVRALELQKQAAEKELEQATKQLDVQLKNAVRQYQLDFTEFTYYKKEALPNAQEIFVAAQVGYKMGDIDLVQFMREVDISTDVKLKYLESVQKVNQSVITINNIINK
jgi:heavy metal efflux system protein